VIEDILRIYGYNNVEVSHSLKANLSYKTATDRKQNLQTLISEQLTANGFDEIMNNSLTKKSYYEIQETYPLKNCVTLVNPLSNDLSVMRQTLLFGGLESIVYNRNRKHSDLCFYEFGNCYFYDADKKKDNDILAEYSESTYAGLWITGKRTHKNWAAPEEQSSVFELKAHIENIMIRIGIGKDRIIYEPLQNDLFSTAMSIGTNNRKLGYFGVVSKAIRKSFDIESEVFFAELNWDLLMKDSEKHKVQFSEISRFPEVSRDLALLIDKSVTFAQIEQVALKSERKLLKNVVLFDVYEGKNLPEGKKSYAVNFIIQDEEKTLTDKQIDKVMSKIQQNLQNELGAQLR
jgi:phenylalanyl-tRNA synthetase beta chain